MAFIRHPKDFFAGLLFIAFGMAAIVIGSNYALGSAARMGPGFFPFYLGLMLAMLGVLIAWTGLRSHRGDDGKLERFYWKPIITVLGSVVGFGLLLKPIGMLLAGVLLVLGASLGSEEFNFRKVLVLAIILSVFCALVFVVGLKLPIPLCPDIESLQSSIGFCRA